MPCCGEQGNLDEGRQLAAEAGTGVGKTGGDLALPGLSLGFIFLRLRSGIPKPDEMDLRDVT
jgi:hypothetical protein